MIVCVLFACLCAFPTVVCMSCFPCMMFQMGDRVGPVGTGEAGSADTGPGGHRVSPVNWSMTLDRQVALVSARNERL